jgi:hypothetical protein
MANLICGLFIGYFLRPYLAPALKLLEKKLLDKTTKEGIAQEKIG